MGMIPEPEHARFGLNDDECWIAGARMSASRLGINFLDFPDGSGFGGARGVIRAGAGRNAAETISLLAFGRVDSDGTNWSDVDFLDVNGDRYPDVIGSGGGLQATLPNGALSDKRLDMGFSGVLRHSRSHSVNDTLGATTSHVIASARNSLQTITTEMGSFNLSSNTKGNHGDSRADWDLMDINGDGLPDRVRSAGAGESGLHVRLNLGYRFGLEERWGGFNAVRVEKSLTAGVRNLGFTFPAYSFGGGATHSFSQSAAEHDLIDVNGDGLLDIVIKPLNDVAASSTTRIESPSTALTVLFNTGAGFTGPTSYRGALPHPIRENATVSRNAGVHFSFSICWPLPPICIVTNPGFYRGNSLGGHEVLLTDLDGDGYLDHVFSDTSGNVRAVLNNHGRTNLLKKVYRPLGAAIDLDYARSGNTQDQPQSRWVLARTSVFDGHPDDGADTSLTTYRYLNGLHDRAERDFYGYAQVIEEHRDTENANALYRTVTREFLTDSFYTKGLLKRELVQDHLGAPFTETENIYQMVDVLGAPAVPGLEDFSATRFPQLTRTDKRFYEGNPSPGKTTVTTHDYDALGNVIRLIDSGDLGATDDIDATIGYTTCPTHVIKPNQITVLGNGVEQRRRDATIDCATGNLTQVRQFVADGTATTDLTYFPDGNLRTVTGPTNHAGQRYSLAYEYDPVVATHVAKISDSFGLSSEATHNLKHAKVETTTDTNGNQTTYVCDAFGRVDFIFGPYEQGQSIPTLDFTYSSPIETPTSDSAGNTVPLTRVPWALTQHVDKDALGNYKSSGTIDTILFTDGLKRVLQTKKDATVLEAGASAPQDQMTVSGRVIFDAFARPTEQFYPVTEGKSADNATNIRFNPSVDTVAPTRLAYDVLDRNVRTTIPDGTSTTISYGFGPDRAGATQFETIVRDANNVQKRTYRNVRELITSVREFNQGATLWTSYAYDALKQITQVTDDQGNVTQVAYDTLGRRTALDNPDTGLTTFEYDLASNLTRRVTANLRANAQAIAYDYDFNRLVAVRYPSFTDNNISYTYGAPGAPNNVAGRITKAVSRSTTTSQGTFEDSEERHYGKLGEVIFERKTVVTFTDPSHPSVFETSYQFDTFGRLQKLIYPDGEVLTNTYDSGGNLLTAKGEKNGFRYDYLKRLSYDKFEQRVLLEAGNGIKTAYTYDAQTRRLATLTAGKANGNLFQNLAYSYDAVGNILNLKNTVDVPHGATYGGPTDQTFVYDELYRLTQARGSFQFAPDKTHVYTLDMGYDSIHNIRTKTQVHNLIQPSGVAISQKKTSYDWSYSYNPAGANSTRPHAPTHIGERSFSYDANGNQLGWTHDRNGTNRTIVWNEENRIESIADQGHVKTYKYDDQGNRTIKRGPQGETIYVNQFFTQRPGATGTKHVFAGTTRIVSKLMKQDTVGANPQGNTPFEKDLYFFHPDHLGSSNYITDTNGKVYEHLEYFPFGETWVEQSSNTQRAPYLFTGKELDEETGLYYFGARYYDPRTSVWQSADPILAKYLPSVRSGKQVPGVVGGVFESSNLGLYTYSRNNPIVLKDPDGNAAPLVQQAIRQQATQQAASGGAVGGGYQAGNCAGCGQIPPFSQTKEGKLLQGVAGGVGTAIDKPRAFGDYIISGQAIDDLLGMVGLGPIFNEAKTPEEFFKPGGKNIGQPGDSSGVRIMPGGTQGAQEKFDEALNELGGKVVDRPTYPGTSADLRAVELLD